MYKLLPLLLMFVNFSPVIPGSYIRPQHLVVYPLFLYVVFMTFKNLVLRIKELRTIVLIFSLIIFWGGVSTFWMKSVYPYNITGILSAIDSLALPIAVICVVSFGINNCQLTFTKELFIKSINTYIFILITVSILILIQIFTGISWWFDYFIDSTREINVAESAMSMGRYSGIYAQPFEAGLAASLGTFLIFYRIKYYQKIHLFDIIGYVFIPFIGILSVSKAFFLICPPLILIYLIHNNPRWLQHILSFLFLTLFGLLFFLTVVNPLWNGSIFIQRYFTSEVVDESANDSIQRYTSGRYASDSSVKAKALVLISKYPIFGFGMSWRQGVGNDVIDGAFDNAYLQMLIYGGIPNLVLYLLLLWAMFYIAYIHRKYSPLESSFLLIITFYIFLAGNGAPCFPQHKFTLAFFTIITLLVHIMAKQREIHNNSWSHHRNVYVPESWNSGMPRTDLGKR